MPSAVGKVDAHKPDSGAESPRPSADAWGGEWWAFAFGFVLQPLIDPRFVANGGLGDCGARRRSRGQEAPARPRPTMQGSVASTFPSACRLLIGRRKSWRVPVGVSWRGLEAAFKASARPHPTCPPCACLPELIPLPGCPSSVLDSVPPATAVHGRAPGPPPALPPGRLPSRLPHRRGAEGECEPVAGGYAGAQALLASGGSREGVYTGRAQVWGHMSSWYMSDLP